MSTEKVDVCVLGGGPGGYVAALQAARSGLKVAVVEELALGGVCLNVGCIPTKTILEIAHAYHVAKNSAHIGVRAEKVTFDFDVAMQHVKSTQSTLAAGINSLFKKYKVQHINARGTLAKTGFVTTSTGKTFQSSSVILAMGSSPIVPPFKGIDTVKDCLFTSHTIWEKMPQPGSRILVVGGGVIGVEFASFYNMVGSKVTVVERLPNILSMEEAETSEQLQKILEKAGVEVKTGWSVDAFDGKIAHVSSGNKKETLPFDSVIMAVGVTPNVEAVEPDIARQGRGIKVDEWMRTSIPGVYAIGDLVDGPALAHKASYEGMVAVSHILGENNHPRVAAHLIPRCVYSTPQVASIGYTSKELQEQGVPYVVGNFPYAHNGRALSAGNKDGFVKMLYHKNTGEILGAHILGEDASEIIASVGVAIRAEAESELIMKTVFAHPTLSEMIQEATWNAFGGGGHG